jgi:hypothetical protein
MRRYPTHHDPATYDSLRQEILDRGRRERGVQRCRKIGLAIQEAISDAIADRGLHVELIDRGFDLAVGDTEPADLDELAEWLQVGARLLEIKATTTGDARMTPKQAETASAESHRYDLCVVDLRNVPADRLDADWDASDVEGIAKVVSSIGGSMKETFGLVEDARTRSIGIRNERALRYNVPAEVWELGLSIDEWVDAAFPEDERQTSPAVTEGIRTVRCLEESSDAQP